MSPTYIVSVYNVVWHRCTHSKNARLLLVNCAFSHFERLARHHYSLATDSVDRRYINKEIKSLSYDDKRGSSSIDKEICQWRV